LPCDNCLRQDLHTFFEIPRFLVEYFNSLEFTKQPRTKIAYAYDLDTFFDFLVQNNRSPLYGMDKAFLRLSDLDKVTSEDISDFLRYCKAYDNNGKIVTNSDSAIKRKLCSVRGMYKYFYRMEISAGVLPEIPKEARQRNDRTGIAAFEQKRPFGNHGRTGQRTGGPEKRTERGERGFTKP